MKKAILLINLLLIGTYCYSQGIKLKPGITYGYSFQALTNPRSDTVDLKRFSSTQVRFNLGPSLTIGNVKSRLSINPYGLWYFQPNKIKHWFNNPYKPRNAFGYGISSNLYITPRKVNPQHERIGLRKSRTADIGYWGFFIGGGWENVKSTYRIPKESEFKNFQFSTIYGKFGISTFSAIKSTDFFIKYGRGENDSRIWEIGSTWSL